MRFEVASAFVLGAALPILETVRRGLGFENVTTVVEDYLAGALLLTAGWASLRRLRAAPIFLVIAWAMLAGGLFPSFFGHLEAILRNEVSGSREVTIVAVKAVLYAICLASLLKASKAAADGRGTHD
ncbi:MAG: hypothetical protein HKP30_17075 [Myxococcales bacterium]|nr:hypothetical protein [Myxococcales bacterium]